MIAELLIWFIVGFASFVLLSVALINDSRFKSEKTYHTIWLFFICMLVGPILWALFLVWIGDLRFRHWLKTRSK